MDFRLMPEFVRFLKDKNLLGDCDEISLAGAGKELVDGYITVREFLLKNIKISLQLHGSKRVFLLHHSQCGAYAASYSFASPAEEKAKQIADMKIAEKSIKGRFPEMEVLKFWAELLDDDGHHIEFSEVV